MQFLWVIGVVVALMAILEAWNRTIFRRLQASGQYPPAGQGTDAEVLRLMQARQKIAAIKLYRDIHGVDLKSAKESVENMARDKTPTPIG